METRRKAASRWLVKERKRGRVRVVGVVQRHDTGRPELAFGRRCKASEVDHEVRVAEIEILTGWRLERDVKAGRAHPDAVTVIDGRTCFLELDHSGKMTTNQMEAKWRLYQGAVGFILVVAMTEKRMQRLRAGAEAVKDRAFFTTFDRLRSAAQPWVDYSGESLKL